MKYLLLVCWDGERMNAQTEPDAADPPDEEEPFPWVDDLRRGGSGSRATSSPRRGEHARSACATARPP